MIEQTLKELAQSVQTGFSQIKDSAPDEAQIRAIFEAQLRKFNLVTREEFDAQKAVLLRTREKLEAMQAQLDTLENEMRNKS